MSFNRMAKDIYQEEKYGRVSPYEKIWYNEEGKFIECAQLHFKKGLVIKAVKFVYKNGETRFVDAKNLLVCGDYDQLFFIEKKDKNAEGIESVSILNM